MSADYLHLCSVILKQCFGNVVESVANCLFSATTRTLSQIVSTTKLPRKEVCVALAVLIRFRLVGFEPSQTNPFLPEYSLRREDILFLLRHPRYIYLMQTKYGNVGASITEELIHSGSHTHVNKVLLNCLADEDAGTANAETHRNTFLQMISDHYIIKMPELIEGDDQDESVPRFQSDECEYFRHPNIDLHLLSMISKGEASLSDSKESNMMWTLNYDRFHQDFRDAIMVDSIKRKLGDSAAECFSFILTLIYNTTDPWQRKTSNQITFMEIKQTIERKSNNLDLIKYLDQYISLLTDDSLGFLRKVGDMGNGQYLVDMERAFESLAFACIESVITERFGSKAARIFRVIRFKKFIEQEDLQKEAMIPAKEAKSLAYNLFQEQFIHVKVIKKPGGGSNGPAKAFYLYQVKQKDTVRMLLDISFKALYNAIERSSYEKFEHKGLIDKSQRLDAIVDTMRERGESDEFIAEIMETFTPPECEILKKVKNRIQALSKAELTLDNSIFLLQMYQHHCTTLPTSIQKFK
ncbi:LOW QUALITY PROTEIN: DNA-directed RNA polymerase III subunit RPC3 [Drosophila tropicalis]|uniref:LOW QUALITY PROTEIN: DNA-directed RNA polymerase III subunit RPC3 n=1 Tax=Drosophila tropicalis TaxID=46794 RepID=UPI0035ABB552